MKLSSQVTSLELSKKLVEKGVQMSPIFWWVKDGVSDSAWSIMYTDEVFTIKNERFDRIPSPTTDELMEILPTSITGFSPEAFLTVRKHGNGDFSASYEHSYDCIAFVEGTSLANALAKLLIHIIEQGLWKPTNYLP